MSRLIIFLIGASVLNEAWQVCHAQGALSPAQINKVMASVSYGTELCAASVSHIFHFLGANSLFEANILQRCFRDVHGSAQHLVAANTAYDNYGADHIVENTSKVLHA